MSSDRLQAIKKLHAFTQAGLGKCKEALESTGGDYYQAVASLLTEERFREKEQAFLVRRMCGDDILDPVTAEEQELMDWLKGHFAWQSVRPHHAFFSGEVIPAAVFSEAEVVFDKLTALTRTPWAIVMWQSAGHGLDPLAVMPPDGLAVDCATVRGCEAAVIRMPAPASINEASFVVVTRNTVKGLLGAKHTFRVFQVFESIMAPDWNLIHIHELVPGPDCFEAVNEMRFENVETSAEFLTDLVRNM